MARLQFNSVDSYLEALPLQIKRQLQKIRKEVSQRIPEAEETISYGMPAFKDKKVFFYFAAFKNHLGIYPPLKDPKLISKLKKYMNEKGNLAFPFSEDVPFQLIAEVALAQRKRICSSIKTKSKKKNKPKKL